MEAATASEGAIPAFRHRGPRRQASKPATVMPALSAGSTLIRKRRLSASSRVSTLGAGVSAANSAQKQTSEATIVAYGTAENEWHVRMLSCITTIPCGWKNRTLGKYGKAAVHAASLLAEDGSIPPQEASESAALKVFPDSHSSREKSCPKDAFLAICQMGVLRNVTRGDYTSSVKNKAYAERALEELRLRPELVSNKRELWLHAVEHAPRSQTHK